MNTIKECATCFSFPNLHAVNLLLWDTILSLTLLKIIMLSRSSFLLSVFLMRWSGCRTGGASLQVQKSKFPPFAEYHPLHQNIESFCPSTDHRSHIRKKVSLIAFRHFFTYTIMIYLRNFVGTKSLNTKQCTAGIYPTIIPSVSRFIKTIYLKLCLVNFNICGSSEYKKDWTFF